MRKTEDLTGRRFGHLIVVEKMKERQDRYCLWRCRCDCGGEVCVNTKRLKRGTVTNCGCIPKSTARNGAKREELTGRRFGSLTVLHPAKNYKGRTCWVCRCDCGNLCTAASHELKAGRIKSCGCKRHLNGQNVRDISGQKFGRLTAIYPTDKRDEKGSVFWHCRCDCGNELDVTGDRLLYGNYKSCGCLKGELQGKIPERLHRIDGTCVELLEKRKYRRDNTSGFRGVYLQKNGKYRVSIGFKRQTFYVGTFKDFDEAVEARLEAERLIHDGFVSTYYRWKKSGTESPLIFEVEKSDGTFHVSTNVPSARGR